MMFGSLFRRPSAQPIPQVAQLGASMLAVPAPLGAYVPDACVAVVIERDGRRRLPAGERIAAQDHAAAWCVHAGPYDCLLQLDLPGCVTGLRLRFALDVLDLHATQQRVDLYLASEADGPVCVQSLARQMAWTLQQECARGCLSLGPSATLTEWHDFRHSVDQLLYARFGVLVQECVQVEPQAAGHEAARAAAPLASSARAAQRLRLELPCLICAVRQAVMPSVQEQFRQHQGLLLRLDQVCLAGASAAACSADDAVRIIELLDAAWALLARLKVVGEAPLECLLAEAERIVSALERATRDVANV